MVRYGLTLVRETTRRGVRGNGWERQRPNAPMLAPIVESAQHRHWRET